MLLSTRISPSMPDKLFSPPVDFLFQESLLYTSIPLRRNVSARISLRWLIRSIHYAESIMLVFSWNGSYMSFIDSFKSKRSNTKVYYIQTDELIQRNYCCKMLINIYTNQFISERCIIKDADVAIISVILKKLYTFLILLFFEITTHSLITEL